MLDFLDYMDSTFILICAIILVASALIFVVLVLVTRMGADNADRRIEEISAQTERELTCAGVGCAPSSLPDEIVSLAYVPDDEDVEYVVSDEDDLSEDFVDDVDYIDYLEDMPDPVEVDPDVEESAWADVVCGDDPSFYTDECLADAPRHFETYRPETFTFDDVPARPGELSTQDLFAALGIMPVAAPVVEEVAETFAPRPLQAARCEVRRLGNARTGVGQGLF